MYLMIHFITESHISPNGKNTIIGKNNDELTVSLPRQIRPFHD